MDRLIEIKINGHHLTKDNNVAGVQHEANATALRMEFDPSWDGFAKKVTFWDAKGQNPVARTLTTDLLEDAAQSTRVYLCHIPGEAMTEAGKLEFVVDGWKDGVRPRSLADTLKVKPAPYAEDAGRPADPTPTQAEQLQAGIDAVNRLIYEAAQAGTVAKNPPRIDEETNTWLVWDLDAGGYKDTGVSALGREGPRGPQGEPGATGKSGQDGNPGKDGADGVGVKSVVQSVTSSADGGTNVITVTLTNGTKATFNVKNGSKGSPGQNGSPGPAGQNGSPGKDGVSPTVTVTAITGGHRVTITDANGTRSFNVKDGKDGSGGGTGGGADGEDGFSPVVTITQIEGGHRVTIEDLNGTQSFDVMDGAVGPAGQDGQDGSPGKDGQDGSPGKDGQDGVSATHSWDGTVLTITSASGTSSANLVGPEGPAGKDGGTGPAGEDGKTPVKGTDYWTAADKAEIISAVLEEMPEGGGTIDEEDLVNLELITLEDIDLICNPTPANTFQKVRAFQDGKEYVLLFGYGGAYYCFGNEAFNDYTVKAVALPEVTRTDAKITFATAPISFVARASGDGFTLHNGSNNVYGEAFAHGTNLRINTEPGIVFTVDTSAMGGFDSDEIVPRVDEQAVWLRSAFETGSSCLKYEAENVSIGLDYKDRDATYSTGFISFVLYEKIS